MKPVDPVRFMHSANLHRVWVGVLLVAALTGCASRSRPKLSLPNVNIPPQCATSIHLVDCDVSVSPPRCRASSVTYRKGCEQIMVVK